jgi:hypothetical protein
MKRVTSSNKFQQEDPFSNATICDLMTLNAKVDDGMAFFLSCLRQLLLGPQRTTKAEYPTHKKELGHLISSAERESGISAPRKSIIRPRGRAKKELRGTPETRAARGESRLAGRPRRTAAALFTYTALVLHPAAPPLGSCCRHSRLADAVGACAHPTLSIQDICQVLLLCKLVRGECS